MEKEQLYTQPECHVIDVEAQSVLCASGVSNAPNPSNPFGGSTEEEW